MNVSSNSMYAKRGDVHVETEGEFAGWRRWTRDGFESQAGPFYHRMDEKGRVTCAFRVGRQHLNGLRNVHGGCYMAFADYCLFATASPVLEGPGVTLSFSCEFLDSAQEGELVIGSCEITRAGRSIIFLRGTLKCGERPLFTFSGSLKRTKLHNLPPT